ncbi:N-acetylmuramic acid 6-phosphate etherase [Deinococcus sonorensis]|uniref:N-acetylmuramic acid 6-phosphate etherase n=2 Tax=Deinococcus sonorensis TaxID=309891 RepID=A0AAU7UFR6_9DEIO
MPEFRPTEAVHPLHHDLDQLDSASIVTALIEDQHQAVQAVQRAGPALARAAELASERLAQGGRLIYVGAGTSGRLGLLDATELTPTFSWPPERALTLLAGGLGAVTRAVEGAEDDMRAGRDDLQALSPTPNDVVIGVAASGTTPYVLAALELARQRGALTIGIANNPGTPLLTVPHCAVLLDTGPEVISGSTRLKAGTSQKIALNTLSSTIMVRLGKVLGNLMVDLQATNLKLQQRALRLVMIATGASEADASQALLQASGRVKTAIVMLGRQVSLDEAERRLETHHGRARAALEAE